MHRDGFREIEGENMVEDELDRQKYE